MSGWSGASYILLIKLHNKMLINIKSLGTVVLDPGFYIYIGSANIRNPLARILRHFRKRKKIKWHIDFLTNAPSIEVIAAIMCYGLTESLIYDLIISQDRFVTAARRFGSTDQKHHITHLFKIKGEPAIVLRCTINQLKRLCRIIELVTK